MTIDWVYVIEINVVEKNKNFGSGGKAGKTNRDGTGDETERKRKKRERRAVVVKEWW
jgi:hypothetical protein